MSILPAGRNTSYSPGATPVHGADLNDIQDCIIGAKHPSLPFPHAAAAFAIQTGTATIANGRWSFGASSQLVSPVRFPVGTRITSLVFGYTRGGVGNITLILNKRNIVTGANSSSIVGLVISSGTGYVTSTLDSTTPSSLLPYVTEADMSLWLEVWCDNVAHIFGGAIVRADRL
jgi:hypothetical protein